MARSQTRLDDLTLGYNCSFSLSNYPWTCLLRFLLDYGFLAGRGLFIYLFFFVLVIYQLILQM